MGREMPQRRTRSITRTGSSQRWRHGSPRPSRPNGPSPTERGSPFPTRTRTDGRKGSFLARTGTSTTSPAILPPGHEQWTRPLEVQQTNTQDHDGGFRIYLSYGLPGAQLGLRRAHAAQGLGHRRGALRTERLRRRSRPAAVPGGGPGDRRRARLAGLSLGRNVEPGHPASRLGQRFRTAKASMWGSAPATTISSRPWLAGRPRTDLVVLGDGC
jgi:hypothetical protein